MEIKPRYDGPPGIEMDGTVADIAGPVVRQRQRLLHALEALTPEQWETPSRCEGWRVQDVVSHLTSTNGFWALSITSGAAGNPTQFLANFDPKATPAAMAAAERDARPESVLAKHKASVDGLVAAIEGLDGAGWDALAECPVGHVPNRLVAHHALWDAWVHERDILLPLGLTPPAEPDEVLASLRYVAALSPAFALSLQPEQTGTLALEVSDPDATVVVTAQDSVIHVTSGPVPDRAAVIHGPAVELLEALSVRSHFDHGLGDDHRWLVGGLAEVFEQA